MDSYFKPPKTLITLIFVLGKKKIIYKNMMGFQQIFLYSYSQQHCSQYLIVGETQMCVSG